MTTRSFVLFVLITAHFSLAACGTDSDNGGSSDTSGSTADTSGSTFDTSGSTSGSTSGDTSGSTADVFEPAAIEACNATPPTAAKTQLSYEADIKPILENAKCLTAGCHTPFQGIVAGELDLSTLGQGTIPEGPRGPVYVPCEPLNSNIIAVSYPECMENQPAELRMPQSTQFLQSTPLTEAEAALLFQWISEGGEATFNDATCP